MRRRDAIALMGSASLAWALAARAQSPAIPVVGYLSMSSLALSAPYLALFREGLKESGFVESRDVAVEVRWAEGRYERLPTLAAELVALKVAVIVTIGAAGVRAVRQISQQIPIVFQSGADPVALGLVASLSRPGGNATGVSLYTVELAPKRLDLLRELIPDVRSVAILHNPDTLVSQIPDLQAAARSTGLALQILEARGTRDLEAAFARLAEQRPQALFVASDIAFLVERARIVALAARHAIPTIYDTSPFVTAGGLVSYGPGGAWLTRALGVYTGRILKGAKPAELPVQQPTQFELVINLKTAKALGLAVPPAILARADEVLE